MSRSRETDYGKGDDDRTEDHPRYREGWEKIDWKNLDTMAPEEIMRKVEEAMDGSCICPTNASGIRIKTLIECPKEHLV